MFTENPWYSMEMFHNQQKIEKHTSSCSSASMGWNMRKFAAGTLNVNIIFIQRLDLNEIVCTHLFQKTFQMTPFFLKNYELYGFVSDLDCFICVWDKKQLMVRIFIGIWVEF